MKSTARRLIERLLRRFDYRMIDIEADPAGLETVCRRLAAKGFAPKTVIDVGVGRGTPWLYTSFPDAKFVLFEALESFRSEIESVTADIDAEVHYCALGEMPAKMSIQVNRGNPTSSSMARYSQPYKEASAFRSSQPVFIDKEVEVRMLDEFLPFAGPALLKLDVEGFEGAVLKGGRKTLANVEVIVSEVSVVRRTELEPTLGSYISLLETLGYSLVNIAEITPMSRGGAIAYMDAVFVRSDSPMRLR